jgi:MFS family permease
VGVLFIAYTFSFADRYILSLLIGPIKQDLGLSDTRISLLHGFAFALFYTFMGIPIGRLADRYSRRTIIAVGIAVWSAATAACGFARTFWQLFTARVSVGIGEAALSPAAYSMIADLFPPRLLGRALSVYSAGAIVGGGVAFIVGGMIIQAIVEAPSITLPVIGSMKSWQVAFIVVGLPGLLVSALMYTVPEPLRRSKLQLEAAAEKQIPLRQVFGFMGRNWRVYVPHFLGFSMLALLFNGILAWTPAFLNRTYGLAIGQSGLSIGLLLLTFGAGGMVAGGLVADRLLDRGYHDATIRTGIIAGLGCLPFVAVAPLMPGPVGALALMAPLWFFAASAFGAAVAALQYVTPNRMRGVVSALYLFTGNLLAVGIGPTVIALITDYVFGDEAALRYSIVAVGVACSVLAIAILSLALRPFRELARSRTD